MLCGGLGREEARHPHAPCNPVLTWEAEARAARTPTSKIRTQWIRGE